MSQPSTFRWQDPQIAAPKPRKAPVIPVAQWNRYKEMLCEKRRYMTLEHLQSHMEQEHKFKATYDNPGHDIIPTNVTTRLSQYQTQFKKWGIVIYQKREDHEKAENADAVTPVPSDIHSSKRKGNNFDLANKRPKLSRYLAIELAAFPRPPSKTREASQSPFIETPASTESEQRSSEVQSEAAIQHLPSGHEIQLQPLWKNESDDASEAVAFRAAEFCFHAGLYEEAFALYEYVWKHSCSRSAMTFQTLYAMAGYAQSAVTYSQRTIANQTLLREYLRVPLYVNDRKEAMLVFQSLIFAIRYLYLPPMDSVDNLDTQQLESPFHILQEFEGLERDGLSLSFLLYHLSVRDHMVASPEENAICADLPGLQTTLLRLNPGPFQLESNVVRNSALQDILRWCHLLLRRRRLRELYDLLMGCFFESRYDPECFQWIKNDSADATIAARDVRWLTGVALYFFLWECYNSEPTSIQQVWGLSIESTLHPLCSLILERLEAFGELQITRASEAVDELLLLSREDLAREFLKKFSSCTDMSALEIETPSSKQTRVIALGLVRRHLGIAIKKLRKPTKTEKNAERTPEPVAANSALVPDSADLQVPVRASYNPTLASSLRSSDLSFGSFKQTGRGGERSSILTFGSRGSKPSAALDRLSDLMGSIRLSSTQQSLRESQASLANRASIASKASTV
jgi:Clr5 domain